MKSQQGITVGFATLFAASFLVNCCGVWHMAGLYERMHAMESKQLGWTIEPTYGGAWIVRNQHGQEVSGGMSEPDVRHYAKLEAQKIGLPEQELRRITFDWE